MATTTSIINRELLIRAGAIQRLGTLQEAFAQPLQEMAELQALLDTPDGGLDRLRRDRTPTAKPAPKPAKAPRAGKNGVWTAARKAALSAKLKAYWTPARKKAAAQAAKQRAKGKAKAASR